jgi:subfamily B ATP-binding cassette protein HlyB/CyaB
LDPGSATAHPTATQTFQALCLLARLHHIAAQPEALLHQLGISPREAASGSQLLQAAKLLGLKAKAVNSTANQLQQTPLPALAFMN